MALWTIRAEYDPEARVWYSIDGDLPGLAADAETLEAIAAKAGAISGATATIPKRPRGIRPNQRAAIPSKRLDIQAARSSSASGVFG